MDVAPITTPDPSDPPEPPRWVKARYYLFGSAPPARYAEWVRQDIQTDAWLWRRIGQAAIGLAIAYPLVNILLDVSPWSLVGMAIGVGIGALQSLIFSRSSRSTRARAMRYYEKRWKRRQPSQEHLADRGDISDFRGRDR